jgi:hypothetical protein
MINEHKKGFKAKAYPKKSTTTVAPSKPRNPVAKNANAAIGGGASGPHKDKKKADKQGDVKHKKSIAAMAEGVDYDNRLNQLLDSEFKATGVNEMRNQRDAYQRDYDSSISGFSRPNDHRGLGQELAHERNNLAVSINGKLWKVFPGQGTADSQEEYKFLSKMKDWAEKKSFATGKKWTVSLTGADPTESIEQGVAEAAAPWETDAEAAAREAGKKEKSHFKKPVNPNRSPRDAAKALAQKGIPKESFNGEYDDEAGMADNNLETLKRAVDGLDNVISAGDNLPEWCQEKIAVAKSMLVAVWDYMESEEAK